MLSAKEKKVVEQYMLCGNWTEAARRAGYTEKTALGKSGMWVKKDRETSEKPEMWDYLQKLRKKDEENFTVSKGRLIKMLMAIAGFDVRKLFDDFKDMKEISEWDDETAMAIAGIKVKEQQIGDEVVVTLTTKEVKAADKNAAIAQLAKMLGYNAPEKIEPVGGFLDFLKQSSQAK